MKIIKKREEFLFSGKVFNVLKKIFIVDNNEIEREVVESSPVVHGLPYDSDGNIYLINEFRVGCEDQMLGFPAGKIDKGEDEITAIEREIEEELGMKPVKTVLIAKNLVTNAGISNEISNFFLVEVEEFKENERTHFPDDGEHIEIVKMKYVDFQDEFAKKITNGEIVGLKTLFLWVIFNKFFEKGLFKK